MAVHFDHSSAGSADAFHQNVGILTGFLYPAGCAMSYNVVLVTIETERIGNNLDNLKQQ